jgi:hypothetical protein
MGRAVTLDAVRSWGLGYALEREPATRDTTHGTLFGDSKRLAGVPFRYDPDPKVQTWRRMVTLPEGSPEIWLGFDNDHRPTPADLIRSRVLPGFDVPMADGHTWTLPVVCRFDETTPEHRQSLLPAYFDLDANGRLVTGEVEEAYRWLWELTQPAWDAMVADGDVTNQEALAVLGGLISANYVANAMELIALRCLSRENSPAGLVALAIDYHTWNAWNNKQKKTKSTLANGGLFTARGPAADSPAIDQPAPTC